MIGYRDKDFSEIPLSLRTRVVGSVMVTADCHEMVTRGDFRGKKLRSAFRVLEFFEEKGVYHR